MKRLARALEEARANRSRTGKEEAIGAALAATARESGDEELALAARICSGRVLRVGDGRALGVGWSLLLDVVRAATGFEDEVLFACARATGDLGEAFGLLVKGIAGSEERSGVPLAEVVALVDELTERASRADKRASLERAFARATPLETKYLSKAIGGGLRIGAQEGVVEGAIARGFEVPLERVRRAAAVVTDIGDLAVLAARGRLEEAHLEPGRPVAFMLATPIETVALPIEPTEYRVEDKIDGVRTQAHRARDGTVALFARGLDRVTLAFPEIARALERAPAGTVLDGEIVAVAPSGRPRPFQALQPRLKKGQPSIADERETPVALIAFDLLADASGPLVDAPWSERRRRLDAVLAALGASAGTGAILGLEAKPLAGPDPLQATLDHAFLEARGRGHEGIVLKRMDSLYEAGRRGQAWIKVKRANATLDVVVVAAEEGHGKRAGVLSDYTFAVWREGELVPVGKAYSGLTDEEIEAMTRRFEASTTERVGGVRIVRPEVVLEVAFDGVQRSARHASGFALRFPRILRIREDKTPDQADQVETVEALLAAQVASGHREADAAGGGRRSRAKAARPRPGDGQLSLFGDDEP